MAIEGREYTESGSGDRRMAGASEMQHTDAHSGIVDLPEIGHWVNGTELGHGPEGDFGSVYNPALGKCIRKVPFADAGIVRKAISAAVEAFPGWAVTPILRRSRILFRYRNALEKRREELAGIITEQNGKTLAEARAELDRGIQVVEFATGLPHLMKGEYLADLATELDSHSIRSPLGVCVGITPFNFPAMVPLWMFPVAIAAGNTFILKPSEKDPGVALRLAEIFEEAGLPPGVFNVVQGTKTAVEQLIMAPETMAISFVGSSSAARAVYRAAAGAGKRAQCLGGAKNHLVVMPDADTDAACSALIGAAYGCAGERCMAISVVVVVGAIGDEMVEKLAARACQLRVGAGEKASTDVGPLITQAHLDRVLQYLEAGIEEGAELVVDGRLRAKTLPECGFFLAPCLFDRVTPEMSIYRDEIFGPVLCVVRATDLDAALAIVNGHDYANGAAIFTRNGASARRFTHEVQAGMIGVNVPIPAPAALFGFGGHKQSLFGPLSIHGTDGVRFYTRVKTVTSRWHESPSDRIAPSGF